MHPLLGETKQKPIFLAQQRRRSHQHLVAPAAGEHRPLVRLRRSVKPGGLQARPRTNLGWRSSSSSERDATAPAHSVGHTDPNPAVIAHQARQDQKGVKRGNRGAALKPPRFSAAEGLGSASAALLPPFTSVSSICSPPVPRVFQPGSHARRQSTAERGQNTKNCGLLSPRTTLNAGIGKEKKKRNPSGLLFLCCIFLDVHLHSRGLPLL